MPIDLNSALQNDPEALSGLLDQIADWLHGDAPSPLSASARRRYWAARRAEALVDLLLALGIRHASAFDAALTAADVLENPARCPADVVSAAELVLDAHLRLGGQIPMTARAVYRVLLDCWRAT